MFISGDLEVPTQGRLEILISGHRGKRLPGRSGCGSFTKGKMVCLGEQVFLVVFEPLPQSGNKHLQISGNRVSVPQEMREKKNPDAHSILQPSE